MQSLLNQKLTELHARKAQCQSKAGFTLVELAIVLVIIGLIIGGVLVGQDLIKAAEIRATITQIESYNAAVNTFRGRYNGIPGDIRNVTDFFDVAAWSNMQNGDGNRLLQSCADVAAPTVSIAAAATGICDPANVRGGIDNNNGEIAQFWHHLSAAELIPGFFDGLSYEANTGTQNGPGTLDISFPRSRMDRNGIGVYGAGGRNYYQLGVTDNATDDTYATTASLTPEEAFNIDQKVDDGRPNTGSVVARGDEAGTGAPNQAVADAAAATTAAQTTPSDATYDGLACIVNDGAADEDAVRASVSTTYALLTTEVTCQLRFRMN